MTERDLLIIKYIYEFKNITKAANALFISQPALTMRLNQIEQELGIKLIERNNKGLEFTDAGMEAMMFSETILKNFSDFRERMHVLKDEDAGILRICAPDIISKYYLPQVIQEFKKEYPKVKFELMVTPSSKVVELMKSHKVNFGFLRNDFGLDPSEMLYLGTNYIAAVSMSPFELKDLPNMQRVVYTTDTYYEIMLDLWWKENFETKPIYNIKVNTLDLCKEMVYSGLGYGILPSVFISERKEAHNIILCDRKGRPVERNTWLAFHSDEVKNNKNSHAFLNFLKEHDFSSFFKFNKG